MNACCEPCGWVIWAMTCDFQQCGILNSVDSDEPVQHPCKLRNSKWCLVSSLSVIEYLSDKQRLWSVCAYAQADLSLCLSHIQHCWKSRITAHMDLELGVASPSITRDTMLCPCARHFILWSGFVQPRKSVKYTCWKIFTFDTASATPRASDVMWQIH